MNIETEKRILEIVTGLERGEISRTIAASDLRLALSGVRRKVDPLAKTP